MSAPDAGTARALGLGLADARAARHSPRASVLLRAAIAEADGPAVSLGELIERLGERAYGLLLVLLALGNVIPGPPGIGALFGIPIAILVGLGLTVGALAVVGFAISIYVASIGLVTARLFAG